MANKRRIFWGSGSQTPNERSLPKVENVCINDNTITFTWGDGTKTVLDSLPMLKNLRKRKEG